MEKTPLSAGQQKVQEYVTRIQNGENKESIMKSLPPSFVNSIEKGLKEREVLHKEKDQKEIKEIQDELGMSRENEIGTEYQAVKDLVNKMCEDRSKAVIDLYTEWLKNIDTPDVRENLAKALIGEIYSKYREAEYPVNPNEIDVWEKALKSTNLPISNENDWLYKGIFPKKGEKTLTRGSFNVDISEELLSKLDSFITSGKIKGNYKFGDPGQKSSSTSRHDAITIYFLEEPTEEVLRELATAVQPYVRGDNLLGKKIADGFFMSEIGSIANEHIQPFITELTQKDKVLGNAVRRYLTPSPTSKSQTLKMSEAEFYAIQDMLKTFNCSITYNTKTGFDIL